MQALAYHGIFMDLLHLEHLSCKIGRPDFDKFKKDAVFAKLLNLAPRLLNLDGPLWRAVQQRAAAARSSSAAVDVVYLCVHWLSSSSRRL